ncbi:hypothetical protein VTJ83DRAFT_7231 [Remersonia thermophila]|uniref:F-box domain-containing protein n=1 Tax=Remersonia thermophila TaxID=72144 RepID=A0ABR4D2W8_9PEZI
MQFFNQGALVQSVLNHDPAQLGGRLGVGLATRRVPLTNHHLDGVPGLTSSRWFISHEVPNTNHPTTVFTTMGTINDLPNELLDAILRELSLGHAHGTLKSLCLASRRLHSVAIPHLYRHLVVPTKWLHLARTLVARPDLAAHGRSLHTRCLYGYYRERRIKEEDKDTIHDPRLRAAFLKRRRVYLAGLPKSYQCYSDDDGDDPYAHPTRSNQWDLVTFGILLDGDHNLPLDLITSLLPNLETIDAWIDGGAAFRFCTPGSLPRLRRVLLNYVGDSCFHSEGMRLDILVNLFRAAGNSLARVEAFNVGSCRLLTAARHGPQAQQQDDDASSDHQKEEQNDYEEDGDEEDQDEEPTPLVLLGVKHANFNGGCLLGEPSYLQNILIAFPCVERFELDWCPVCSKPLDFEELGVILRDHAPRMKFLRVDIGSYRGLGAEELEDFVGKLAARGVSSEIRMSQERSQKLGLGEDGTLRRNV